MVKRVLLVAFHFPPVRGSSGVQRTVALARHLGAAGWQPLVLTVSRNAYPQAGPDGGAIDPQTVVRRAWALDAGRHLAIAGRHPRWAGTPDRWSSWRLSAVPVGLAMIRRYRPQLIWSTYPIASAHCIGLALARRTGLPWVADFRDPMTEEGYPEDPRRRAAFLEIERATVATAARCVFVTEGLRAAHAARYPESAARMRLIPNGFDEEDFQRAMALPAPASGPGPLRIVHSGVLYPSERDPTELFHALAALKRSGAIDARDVRFVLRATAYDDRYRGVLAGLAIDDLVELAPPLPYHAALAEMLHADGLLLLQAENCNGQIPAKLYEYVRARRPILALTHPAGETAGALRGLGIGTLGRLDDRRDIERAIGEFLATVRSGGARLPSEDQVRAFRRGAQVMDYGRLFDSVLDGGAGP